MSKVYNRAGHACTTTGTGTVTLGAALGAVAPNTCSYLSFATAGAADGDIVSYLILDSNGACEYGTGTYTAAGPTLSRTLGKSSTGSLLNLSASSQVFITLRQEDLLDVSESAISFRNILGANGGLEIWQRGAGDSASIAVAASTTAYTADRWYITTGANEAFTIAAAAGLTNQSQFCAQVQRNSGQTGTAAVTFGYPLTKEECIRLRGKTITLQFYTSTGANWSPTSGTFTYNVYFGTGTEGKRGGGFTGETNPLTGSVNLATSASAAQTTKNSGATTVATNVTQGEVQFTFSPTGTASTNDWVKLDDVQLEQGGFFTDFERPPIRYLFHECQRHYAKTFPYNTAPAQSAGAAGALAYQVAAASNSRFTALWMFQASMRSSPTITTYNPSAANANWRDVLASADVTVTVDPTTAKSADRIHIGSSTTAATIGNSGIIHAQADSGL